MKKIPLLLDKPLNSPDADQFGHEHYAEVLFDLIANKELSMPYNIGLLGQWGVGKSSIKELCRNKLNSMKNIHCIDFNAWKYGGDCIKRALLKTIYINIGGRDEEIKDAFSRQITRQILALNDMKEISKNWGNVLLNYFQIIISVYGLFFIYNKCLPHLKDFGQACASISFATLAGVLIKELLNKNNLLTPIFQNITKVDLPETTAEVYEEFLIKKLKKYKKRNKEIDKIVIFVDDIDRLPTAKEMVDGINAIRSFMDIKLKSKIGFIFVVSCCEHKISDALITINSAIENNCEDSCSKQTESKRFLDKIFHFRIDIPPFPYRDMINYSKNLIEEQIPNFDDFETQLVNSGTDLENLLCRLIYPNVQNPRQAIQILNTFFQSWNIAIRRESDEMNDKAGGLAKGIVTKHPLTLAILAVLKVDFPYFYKELLIEPKLLSYILEVLRIGKTPSFYIDSKIRDKFLEVSDEETKTWKLKPYFYDLNQYLNLINNKFELPLSLKPFLLLNQNLSSREYGEQAYEIEETLIHNSPEKLLRILNLDNNKLSVENAQLIKSVYESLSYNLHKENAFSTIIKLISFISDETKFLIDSFADTLYKNNRYREILSVDDYKKLLYSVSKSKVDKVIASLNKTYRTKYSYDTSSDEDKIKMNLFKEASNVLLDFYNVNQEYADKDFCSWIISPIFASESTTDGEDFSFGFKYTYNAFKNYDFLYKYASIDYVKTFINEFIDTDSTITSENKQNVLNTVEKALDYMLDNNSEEFNLLLGKFINIENTELFNFIINYTNKNIEKLSEQNINTYLLLLIVAIEDKISNNIKTEFEFPVVIDIIKNLLMTKFLIIKPNNYNLINKLCSMLIDGKVYLNKSIELARILKEYNYNNIDEIEKVLIENIFEFESNLQDFDELKQFLFENYHLLSEDNKIVLSQNIIKNTITEDVSSCLEKHLESFLNEYVELVKINQNTQIIDNLLNATYELTENVLIPNENNEYFKQLNCLLELFIYGNKNTLKNLICLVLNDNLFATEFCKIFGEIIHKMGNEDWDNDDRIIDIFNDFINEDDGDDYFDCVINIFKTISRVQTDEILTTLYNMILKNNYNIKNKISWLLAIDKVKIYTANELVSFMTQVQSENDIEHIVKIWRHFLDLYNTDEREMMLSNTLFESDDVRFFKSLLESIHMITNGYVELYNIINKNSIDNNILKLLPKRPIITDMLIGENRKMPSKILLLNTKILDEIDLDNKFDIIKQTLQWSFDLYNDIMRDTEIRGFSENLKGLISKIFEGKTFGKIKFKNK